MTRKLLFILTFAFIFSACSPQSISTSQTTTTETPQADIAEIYIENFVYSPQELRVKPGQTIVFTNKDIAPHSVTGNNGEFDSGIIGQNETATFTAPTTPRVYPFQCSPHPNITGILVVE